MSTTVTIYKHVLTGNLPEKFMLDLFLPEFEAAATETSEKFYPGANIDFKHDIQERASGCSRGTRVEVVQDGEFSEDEALAASVDYDWSRLCDEERFYE